MGRAALLALLLSLGPLAAGAQQAAPRTTFRVKYIADGAVYLEGGREAGLAEGQHLVVRRTGTVATPTGVGEVTARRIIAELAVTSVADTSAVCEIQSSNGPLRVGDIATLEGESTGPLAQKEEAAGGRSYPQLIAFTGGDPLEAEAREAVPRPKLPEINRARGRVGVEYNTIVGRKGSAIQSRQVALVARMDMTRIGGTYWNFTGYWRGRLDSRSTSTQPLTVNDLINRTYHLGLFYNNPNSRWAAGIGRLYLPWASSLDTLDGGYLARRIGGVVTIGMFAGSTPDPTSWSYNPDRRIGGTFVNFQAGGFDSVRYTGTFGIALSAIRWHAEREFAFVENSLFFKRALSLYQSLQFDGPSSIVTPTDIVRSQPGVSRSFVTLRIQPFSRLSFDLSHNYFRDLPTFDPLLVSTGLLDRLIFQGFSGGVRLDLPWRVGLYGSAGRSSRTGDTRFSWNQLYGITFGNFLKTGFRTDLRYAKFDSAFGRGDYRAVSISRQIGEGLRWEAIGGQQNYFSPSGQLSRGRFATTTIDWFLGASFYIQGGYTWQRGDQQNYDQWFTVLGRRF